MKVTLTQEVELSTVESWRVFRNRLEALMEQPGRWVRDDGHVWEDDPEWRHGSVNEVRVKYKSAKAEKQDIEYLKRQEQIRAAAQALAALLDSEER